MNEHREHEYSASCGRDDCPFEQTIGNLNKTVFVGNGTPALTVQISNLATKIETTHHLILGATVSIPAIVVGLQFLIKLVTGK